MQREPMQGCCFKACGYQYNPLDVKNTLPAGHVCEKYKKCDPCSEEHNCLLATAYIADQEYLAGYCAGEALVQGTFFPELVRPMQYKGGRPDGSKP